MGDATSDPKLLGGASVRVRLAAACMAVLITGAWLAPEQRPADTTAAEERPAPLLEEQVQRRAPAALVAGVQAIAATAKPYSVAILPATERLPSVSDHGAWLTRAPGPAGFGTIVTPEGMVLTHASAVEGRTTVSIQRQDGHTVDATLAAYDPRSGAVLLRTGSETVLPVAPVAATLPQPGTLAAAVAMWNGQPSIAPVFLLEVTEASYRITASAGLRPGTPLFSPEGELLAITADASRGFAIPAAAALAALTPAAASGRPIASLGMSVQALSEPLAAIFGPTGVLVADVLATSPAAAAGIRPGDVLMAIGDRAVGTPEEAMAAITSLAADVPVALNLARDRKPVTLEVTPAPAFIVDTASRARRNDDGAIRAADALTSAQMTGAGVDPDAAILRLDNRPVASPAEVERELGRRGRPHAIYVEEEGRRFFAVVAGAQ